MTTTNPTPTQRGETLEPEPILLDRGDVLDAVALFCSNFETLGERFKKQLRNTIRAIPPRRAAVAGPRGDASQLLDTLKAAANYVCRASSEYYDAETRDVIIKSLTHWIHEHEAATTSSPAPAESEEQAPERVKLWICCFCQTPRQVGLTVCDHCPKRLHDTVEYVRADLLRTIHTMKINSSPAPAESDESWEATLARYRQQINAMESDIAPAERTRVAGGPSDDEQFAMFESKYSDGDNCWDVRRLFDEMQELLAERDHLQSERGNAEPLSWDERRRLAEKDAMKKGR